MEIMMIVLVMGFLIAIFYIVRLKRSLQRATKDIRTIDILETNSLLTSTNTNQELCALLNEVNQLLVTIRNIENNTETKNRQLQKTIVNISHDLKTPLTSALGYIELLQRYDLSKEEQAKYQSIIIEKLKRLSQLIEDFFAFTKIISSEEKIELEKSDINRILEEELVCYYEDFTMHNRKIHITGSQKIELLTNERMLRRIFDNIIINAYKHSDSDVYVDIKVDTNISISFKNKMIDTVDPLRIFDEFYTADISRTKQNTGLGLAIVKEFTSLLDGHIEATIDHSYLIITLTWNKNIVCT